MPNRIRVLVPIDSREADAFKLALAYALKICEAAEPPSREIILLVHTKYQLEHTSLAAALGVVNLKALRKGSIAVSDTIRLRTDTMRTLRNLSTRAVLLVYYAEEKILDFTDGLSEVVGVVAVPDIPGEADSWVERWGARVHGRSPQAPAELINDQVVVHALETLTRLVNLSTGLGHPRDKDMANQILRILRAKGHSDPSGAIKSWAIRHGWKPDGADDLQKLARKIWSLKAKPTLSQIHNARGRYEQWRNET